MQVAILLKSEPEFVSGVEAEAQKKKNPQEFLKALLQGSYGNVLGIFQRVLSRPGTRV